LWQQPGAQDARAAEGAHLYAALEATKRCGYFAAKASLRLFLLEGVAAATPYPGAVSGCGPMNLPERSHPIKND